MPPAMFCKAVLAAISLQIGGDEVGCGPLQPRSAPIGRLLALGVREPGGPIRLYDIESGEEVLEITGFDTAPRALAFSQNGRRLASSLTDTTVLLWDLP